MRKPSGKSILVSLLIGGTSLLTLWLTGIKDDIAMEEMEQEILEKLQKGDDD